MSRATKNDAANYRQLTSDRCSRDFVLVSNCSCFQMEELLDFENSSLKVSELSVEIKKKKKSNCYMRRSQTIVSNELKYWMLFFINMRHLSANFQLFISNICWWKISKSPKWLERVVSLEKVFTIPLTFIKWNYTQYMIFFYSDLI